MGLSRGTGVPLWFKCSECRKDSWRHNPNVEVERTGKTKGQASGNEGNLHSRRQLRERHQYRCKRCGHVGWTNHKDILDYPLMVTSPQVEPVKAIEEETAEHNKYSCPGCPIH